MQLTCVISKRWISNQRKSNLHLNVTQHSLAKIRDQSTGLQLSSSCPWRYNHRSSNKHNVHHADLYLFMPKRQQYMFEHLINVLWGGLMYAHQFNNGYIIPMPRMRPTRSLSKTILKRIDKAWPKFQHLYIGLRWRTSSPLSTTLSNNSLMRLGWWRCCWWREVKPPYMSVATKVNDFSLLSVDMILYTTNVF